MYYIVTIWLRSQKLASSTQCKNWCDAYKTNVYPLPRPY